MSTTNEPILIPLIIKDREHIMSSKALNLAGKLRQISTLKLKIFLNTFYNF